MNEYGNVEHLTFVPKPSSCFARHHDANLN